MNDAIYQKRHNDFAVNCIFIAFTLLGLFLAPQLSLQLEPSPKSNKLTVSFNYPNASPRVVEQEVSSVLESVFSGMKGLQTIRSVSKTGSGQIELDFDDQYAIEKIRFAIVSRIRQVWRKMPEKLSFPQVHFQSTFENTGNLLSYALIGNGSTQKLRQMAEQQIPEQLSAIKGIDDILLYGLNPLEWKLTYDRDQLQSLGLEPEDLATAIRNNQQCRELGVVELSPTESRSVQLRGSPSLDIDWLRIPLAKRNERLLYLHEVAKVNQQPQAISNFHRINGMEVVNMVIKADPKVNQIALASKLRKEVAKIAARQSDWQFILAHDSTEFLRKELRRIAICTLAALAILLGLVLLASRNLRYTLLILIVVLANISIAFIFYYSLGIALHLYSLIGITVSLGIVIDNSIVMLDHLRKRRSRKVFLAILAATLTSIGAIILIFFLDTYQREALSDFALVFGINLFISLVISLFFTPALFRTFSLTKEKSSKSSKPMRMLVRFNRAYTRYINLAMRFRALLLLLLVLLFGLPIFLLPARLEGESDWVQRYNATLGSRFYSSRIKPIADVVFGGSLRLFLDRRGQFAENKLKQRMALHLKAKLPEGHTAEQMNSLIKRLEQFILQYDGVEQSQATVSGAQKGSIVVYFKKAFEATGSPQVLKLELLREINKIGHADFEVYGVGRGFDNEVEGGRLNQYILLNGYHYESLQRFAAELEKDLLKDHRIDKVYTNSKPSFYAGKNKERYFTRPAPELLKEYDIQLQELANAIQERSRLQNSALSVYTQGQQMPVQINSRQNAALQQWDLMHAPIPLDSMRYTRLQGLTGIQSKEGYEDIVRENQQYQLVVGYNYIGQSERSLALHQETIKALRAQLPVGFTAKDPIRGFWESREQNQRVILAILLSIALVFVIATVLFNSIRQPLLAIGVIPFSFIGLFFTTCYFDFNFDQGGFAAFLLLSGLSVNAVFFITNDYNNLKKKNGNRAAVALYLKAFNGKIFPIILMSLSTILGLLPFLLFGKEQPFWYALAICTISGLLFSMIGLLLWLPAFFNFKNQKVW